MSTGYGSRTTSGSARATLLLRAALLRPFIEMPAGCCSTRCCCGGNNLSPVLSAATNCQSIYPAIFIVLAAIALHRSTSWNRFVIPQDVNAPTPRYIDVRGEGHWLRYKRYFVKMEYYLLRIH